MMQWNEICRDLGHAWAYHSAKVEGKVATSVLLCDRCNSKRTQRLVAQGRNAGRLLPGGSYSYVEGYLRKGQGRATAAQRATLRVKRLG